MLYQTRHHQEIKKISQCEIGAGKKEVDQGKKKSPEDLHRRKPYDRMALHHHAARMHPLVRAERKAGCPEKSKMRFLCFTTHTQLHFRWTVGETVQSKTLKLSVENREYFYMT